MLVVFVGRPGTGKTTLARLAAVELTGAHLRIDEIEAAILRSGVPPPLGVAGYAVAHEVAASCLRAGSHVVVDAVSPVAAARAGWVALAEAAGTSLWVIEVEVTDPAEHRRRVETRMSDVLGLVVPTWAQVTALVYEPWDTARDGPRLLVHNDGEPEDTMHQVRAYLTQKP
ncbi:ATP-binding protein [Actinophytocola sp.]|uniref:AAA family ATPase n=1 Tax=Actinophytocola sp. TaxID=1872138 RepID=UPI002ED1FED0